MNNITLKQFLLFIILTTSLVLVTTAVYWPGLHGPFLLDDPQTLEPAQMNHFTLKSFLEISLHNDTGPLGRPIAVATFALNHLFLALPPSHLKPLILDCILLLVWHLAYSFI